MSIPLNPNTMFATALATIMHKMISHAITKTDISTRNTFVPLPPSTPRTEVKASTPYFEEITCVARDMSSTATMLPAMEATSAVCTPTYVASVPPVMKHHAAQAKPVMTTV